MVRATILVSLLLGASALADGGRVLLLVDEQHDGARAEAGGAEAQLAQALMKGGFTLVERYDAEQARSRVSIERLLHGETAGLDVTGLSADVLVVARVTVKTEEAPYGITYPVHQARLDLRALSVDTGRIFHVGSEQGATPGDAGAAAAKVAQAAAPKLLSAISGAATAGGPLELRVAGLHEAAAADRLAASLSKIAGAHAKVRYVSADVTLIDVSGLDGARLEAALAGEHLVVARRSAHAVDARLDEAAAARRSVQVAQLVNQTGIAWLDGVLCDVMEAELTNSKYLQPMAGRPDAKHAKAEIVIAAVVDRAGPQLRLSARALRSSDGAVLAAAQLFGAEAQAAELARDLVWKLDPPLYLKLSGKSSLEGYVAPLARHAVAAAPPSAVAASGGRVRIEEVKLGDLYPARLGYYAQKPLGRVILRNDGASPAEDVRVEVSLGELSGGAQTLRVPPIAAGARVEVPLKLVLERQRLLEVTQRRPARVDLALVDGDRREPFTEPVVLWDRNALDWNEPDSVAAFVTPKDPVVIAFAADAARLEAPTLPPALRAAAQLFDAELALGLRYQRDPLSPYGEKAVDTVQFPRETLARRIGDCDDLAVLYAALVQASGREARLLLTPGHILVAVDSELPAAQVARLGGDKRVLMLDGRPFVPVEITKLDGGFAAAWDAGLAEVGRYPDKLSTVDIARAWATWPPFPQEAPSAPPAIPVESAQKLLFADGRRLQFQPEPGDARGGDNRLAQAIAHARRGDSDAARRLFQPLTESPQKTIKVAAWNGLGNLDTLRGAYAEAAVSYQKALRAGAHSDEVEHNLGVASFLAGKGSEARRHLERGTGESKKLIKRLGLSEGDSAEAREGLRGAAGESRLDPAAALIWIQ